MVSESKKKSNKKYDLQHYKQIMVRMRTEYVKDFEINCTVTGTKPATALRYFGEAIAAGNPAALELLRNLAYSGNESDTL